MTDPSTEPAMPGPAPAHGFLAHMGHEMRSPASSILAHAEALKNGVFGPVNGEQKDALRAIEGGVGRLLEIFKDMQVIASLSALPSQAENRPCRLADLTARVISFAQEYASRRGVALPRSPLPEILCDSDPHLLRQMLSALFLACIESAETGDGLRLAPCPDHAQRLTLRLERAAGGAGMLAAAGDALRQNPLFARAGEIASLLGAEIRGEDLPQGGWEIQIRLPGVQEPEPLSFAAEETAGPGAGAPAERPGSPRILVAEDQLEISQVIRLYLESLGYQVVTAFNGQDAWRLCLSDPPDLLILDMHMPVMSGVEVMRRVRAHSRLPLARVPIISLSGLDEAGESTVSIAHGADAHLAKPFHLHQLSDLLGRVLQSGEGAGGGA